MTLEIQNWLRTGTKCDWIKMVNEILAPPSKSLDEVSLSSYLLYLSSGFSSWTCIKSYPYPPLL